MSVRDIYGSNPEALRKLNLPGDIVASSFGQLASKADAAASGVSESDLARAVLMMTTNNIAHIAYLTAKVSRGERGS